MAHGGKGDLLALRRSCSGRSCLDVSNRSTAGVRKSSCLDGTLLISALELMTSRDDAKPSLRLQPIPSLHLEMYHDLNVNLYI
jgi:hypothetical protein